MPIGDQSSKIPSKEKHSATYFVEFPSDEEGEQYQQRIQEDEEKELAQNMQLVLSLKRPREEEDEDWQLKRQQYLLRDDGFPLEGKK